MLADRALQATLRNFSTLVLVVGLVTVPLHLTYAIFFRDVIAVGEIHAQIENVGSGRQVRNVGAGQLSDARTAYLVLTAIELSAIPLFIRATRRVLDEDELGEVPEALNAWRHTLRGPWMPRGGRELWFAVGVGVAFALIVGFLTESTGLLLVQALDPDIRFIADGLVRGSARAFAAPFSMVPVALGISVAKEGEGWAPNLK